MASLVSPLSVAAAPAKRAGSALVREITDDVVEVVPYARLREVTRFLRDEANVTSLDTRRQIIESFRADLRIDVFEGPAYQYFGIQGTGSRYLTPTYVTNPVSQLALPATNPGNLVIQYNIATTRALMGTVASQVVSGVRLPGGAFQIYVPSRTLLSPVKLLVQ
jgi:hypothetical protein